MGRVRTASTCVFLVVLAGCAGLVRTKCTSATLETECIQNMTRLWASANALTRVKRVMGNAGTNIPIRLVRNPKIRVEALVACRRQRAERKGVSFSFKTECPRGGRYPDFNLYDGPSCPNGHRLPRDVVRDFDQFFRDYYDK